MRIYPYNLGSAQSDDLIFRQSRLWLALGTGICLLFPAAGVAFLLIPHGPPAWFAWVWIVGGMLTTLFVLRRLLRTLSRDNWLLRCNSRLLLIKVGPIWSRDASAVFVAELNHVEIEWVRAYRHTTITRDAGRRTSRPCGYLEIQLSTAKLEDLRSCIATAGAPRSWHGWTTSGGVPVSVTAAGLVRLQWYAPDSFVTPSLKKAVRLLGQQFPVQPEISSADDFTVPTADKQKMEQQIVVLVEQGQLLEATKLARKRYGCSLTEAHTFVEQLRGTGKPSPQ